MEKLTLKDLRPNPKNPRKISDEKLRMLKRSLDEFGSLDGIIYNRKSGQLVGGHQRQKALPPDSKITILNTFDSPTPTGTVAEGFVTSGGEKYPYREVDWAPSKEKAANIAANKGAGEWEADQLTQWLKELKADDYDLDLTMFDTDELAKFDLGFDADKDAIQDEIPETEQNEFQVKLGDIWQLGDHRLLCGDSTLKENVEKLMQGEKADLWITDPPYGVSYQSNGAEDKHKKIENDAMPIEDMKVFWQKVCENVIDATSNESPYYWFACQGGDQMMMMMMAISAAGWKVRHELIWAKDSLVMGRCDYHYQHEPIFYGWKLKGKHNWYSDRKQTSLLNFPRPKASDLHPTMKPVELIQYLIGNSSKPGQIVIDTFCGSGTTLIACEKTERKCRAIELDPHYCSVIIKRWQTYSGKTAVKL